MATRTQITYRALTPGDTAPWFKCPATNNPNFVFDTAGGRYLLLCFLGSAGDQSSTKRLETVQNLRGFFDDANAAFFGVTSDPDDRDQNRLTSSLPGIRHFWDLEENVARAYGAAPLNTNGKNRPLYRRQWVLLDPAMRVLAVLPFKPDLSDCDALTETLKALPPAAQATGTTIDPPVLILPNVFEPELCERLINLYQKDGGRKSGFMREVDGKTVRIEDSAHKVRSDITLTDDSLIQLLQSRVKSKIVPQIQKAYQFKVTRMERYIVACYTAQDGGHFRAHRDNTTKGTAHRRFAVTINLNGDYEGGEISFPEYSPRTFKPPPGGAVIFSCSLLHQVSKMTSGTRYAFLPFLYDDAAAREREANNSFLSGEIGAYTAARNGAG